MASRQRLSSNNSKNSQEDTGDDDAIFSMEMHEAAAAACSASKRKLDVLEEKDSMEIDDDNSDDEYSDYDYIPSLPPPKMPASVLLTRSQSREEESSSQQRRGSLSGSILRAVSEPIYYYPDQQEMQTTIASPAAMQQQDPMPPPPPPGTLLYSWGGLSSGLQSLHDDDGPRTVAHESLVQSDSRLGKPGSAAVISVATSSTHSACSTITPGTVLTCGYNQKGCVDPNVKNTPKICRPMLLESMNTNLVIHQVSCGYDHTAALSEHGTVLTWGSNEYGQLGHRPPPKAARHQSFNNSSHHNISFCSPQGLLLTGGRRAAAVACGHYFTLVLTTRMTVLACGIDTITGGCSSSKGPSASSSLSSSSSTSSSSGVLVASSIPALQGLPLVSVSAGHHHAVVLTSSGTAYAWGLNEMGCCGRPFPKQLSIPVEMHVPLVLATTHGGGPPSPTNNNASITTARLSSSSSSKRNPFPNWATWEENIVRDGEDVLSLADDVAAVHAACGESHTVLVTRSGRLLVCGSNCHGQLGLSPHTTQTSSTEQTQEIAVYRNDVVSPVEPLLHPEFMTRGCTFVTAECGSCHTLVLDNEGNVWQIGGRGSAAAAATGPYENRLECVLRGKNILSIDAGGDHSIAIAAPPSPSSFLAGGSSEDWQGTTTTPTFQRQFSISLLDNTFHATDKQIIATDLEELLVAIGSGKEDYSEKTQLAAAEELANRTEELLQHPPVMNSLFFGPKELDSMYSKLMQAGQGSTKIQQIIATGIERGIAKGLESIAPERARMIYPEAVRCLLVYIQFFDRPLDDEHEITFDARGFVISGLMEAILGLPFEGYKAFLKWAMSLYAGESYAKMLVKPLLCQLKKGLKVVVGQDNVHHTSLTLGAVPLVVSVLQWLYNTSERAGGIAKPEDFYSDIFDNVPAEALYGDLHELKKCRKSQQQVSKFYICASPFLFSPSVKRNLLKIENQIEMLKVAAANSASFDPMTRSIVIDPFFKLEVERSNMLEETLATIKKTSSSDLRRSLQVSFKGEKGVDAGGVTKEFFQLLSEELFDLNSGMWTDRFGNDITWFNSDCMWDDEGYELTGVLVGLALYNSVLLDVHFPMAVYRKLLGYPLGLEDMVDPELKRGFRQLLDYDGDDIEDIFCLSFVVTWTDGLGKERKVDLKPGGSNIPVTSDNKEEYVRLYVTWLLVDSIYPQWESFERGVMRVMEDASLNLFRPEEFELLVVGSPELDFDALEAHAQYEGGYDKDSETVKNFWRFIKTIDRESQLQFLKFATGSPKAPIGGLGELKIKIQRAGPDSPQLPTSHTCFNTLILPDYDSYEKLEERLSRAIKECEGFGLE
jgi:ubiquitin-protein ligase E3 A